MRRQYDNDLEQFVQENADEYRMFPSEKVWKGIQGALHTRRKWYGLGLGFLLLLTGGAVTWVMMNNPAAIKKTAASTNITASNNSSVSSIPVEKVMEKILSFNPTPETEINAVSRNEVIEVIPSETFDTDPLAVSVIIPEQPVDAGIFQSNVSRHETIVSNEPAAASVALAPFTKSASKHPGTALSKFFGKIPLSFLSSSAKATTKNKSESLFAPYTIESVVNSYKFIPGRKKISWQFFITPTISYRKLSVNKDYDNFASVPVFSGAPGAGPNYPFAPIGDVNRAVTHKPDMGLQVGLSGRYPLTPILKLRGGIQVNINRYDIKAFAYNAEPATLNLNNGAGNSANAVSTWAYYRNYNGYTTDWLKNYYVSVSAPIGLELKVLGNKQRSIGIAGTIQPTYILKDRAFLISTDYKNYAEVPWLIRHTNVSSSFEAFVNFDKGNTKWQVGPQVRYQMLSSFHNKYPVKENLFDFGLKLGVSLNQ